MLYRMDLTYNYRQQVFIVYNLVSSINISNNHNTVVLISGNFITGNFKQYTI